MFVTGLDHAFDRAQLSAASTLQDLVPELVSLSLNAKQVHWNVTGAAFVPLHDLTDEIASDANSWADLLAERVMALGLTVDARPGRVAATDGHVPARRIRDREAIIALIELIDSVSSTTRAAVDRLGLDDPVGQDLAIQVLHGLERYRWMLRAQLSGSVEYPAANPGWSPVLEAVG